jgi:L-asparaginase II
MSSTVVLMEQARNGFADLQHFGAVAVVNAKGQVLASAGDPHLQVFSRSCLKPLQALPFLEQGGMRQYGFGARELALMCASHNGEDMHTAVVERILTAAQKPVSALLCGCHVPLRFSFFDRAAPEGAQFDERFNNCSGKHAGFLAYCAQHGLPSENYIDAGHPLQQAIRQSVAAAARIDSAAMDMCIDGCSAPNYALPLSAMATSFARIASAEQDAEFGESFDAIFKAMTSHPELVSGTDRNDEAFMRIGEADIVCKVGADGLQVAASKSRGEAFALKITDANKTALYAASVEVMAQREWLSAAQLQALEPWRAREIRNARGVHVATRSTRFELHGTSH